jgi:hypothetical protein
MLRNSGDTGVIGGIVNTQVTEAQIGIPFISRLPIIGALFRRTSKTESQTELLIMVTPKIVGRGSSQDTSSGSGLDDFGGSNVSTNFDNGFGGSNVSTNFDNGFGASNASTNFDNGFGASDASTNFDDGFGASNASTNISNGLGETSDNVDGTNVSVNIDNEFGGDNFGGSESATDSLDGGAGAQDLGPDGDDLGIDSENI